MNIAGIKFAIERTGGEGFERVIALWENLFAPGTSSVDAQPVLVRAISRTHGAPAVLCPPDGAQTVSASDDSSLRTAGGVYWLSRRGITAEISHGSLRLEIAPEFWTGNLFEQRDMFLVTMSIALRLRRIFGFHGNGLEKDGTGVLVIGDSGAGKTTLTLALIREGWRFLADDAIGLTSENGLVEARALRQGFSFTPEAIARNDTGGMFRPESWPLGTGKSLCLPGDEMWQHYRPSCVPRALFFCEVGRQEQTEVRLISRTTALGLCMRQAVGLAIDPALTQVNIDMLRDLVDQSQQFRIVSGRDVLVEPCSVSELILGVAQQAA